MAKKRKNKYKSGPREGLKFIVGAFICLPAGIQNYFTVSRADQWKQNLKKGECKK